jgi:hypothetical protein
LKRLVFAILLCLLPLAAAAERPEEWDLEQRLAERFDSVKSAKRLAAEIAKNPKAAPDPAQNSPGVRHYVIDGRTNPELYLPHELFDGLLTAFDPNEFMADEQRGLYGSRLAEFGWDSAAFWPELERISAEYVRLRRADEREKEARCRARFEALELARKTFGRKQFDAFLYGAIAPHGQLAQATNDPNPAATLRREARGCR